MRRNLSEILKDKIIHINEMIEMSNRYNIGIGIQLTKIKKTVHAAEILNIQDKFRSFDYISSFNIHSDTYIFSAYFTKEIGITKVATKLFHICQTIYPEEKIVSSYNFYHKQDHQFLVDLIEGIFLADKSESSYLINFEHEQDHIIL